MKLLFVFFYLKILKDLGWEKKTLCYCDPITGKSACLFWGRGLTPIGFFWGGEQNFPMV